ncbi:duf652 domain containing protein [Grosmannia clavigera kw1407]|uniref:Duf652 domain containing protein n=1 Tax=Grosmannia clavigera (strain kw1407 / UAMH 11150) TaxID=655863 RepID=F0XHA6_GROCL|nr:duf652 domain containing protein [Grosmannia clavigera kw1407]EFX02825.1 duf652 domain containing protein [Grosmannia clavigera kw1407]
MGVAKTTRKFGQVKRVIGQRDARLKKNKDKAELGNKKKESEETPELVREIPQQSVSLFHMANTAMVPPYQVLVDTNFLSHTVQRKLPLLETRMDCLYATCRPILTDCFMAELEKLGPKYRIALKIARDERWERATCTHKGGVFARFLVYQIMSVARGKYVIEGLPDAPVS